MLKAGRLRLPAFMASPARASKMVVDVTQRLQTKCCDAVGSFCLLLPELVHLVGDVIQEHLRVFIWWGCRAINWRLIVITVPTGFKTRDTQSVFEAELIQGFNLFLRYQPTFQS